MSDGVRLGYQVIDTYLKQGQKIARQFAGPSYGAETGHGHPEEPDLRSFQLLTELMANWSDLVGVYTEALSSAPGFIRPSGQPEENPSSAAAFQGSGRPAVQLAYELASRRPALVDVEFFPGRDTLHLAAHGLRCLDSNAEIAVVFDRQLERQRTVISIQVPDDQPPGLYTGTLLDSRDGSAVGVVSLRIR